MRHGSFFTENVVGFPDFRLCPDFFALTFSDEPGIFWRNRLVHRYLNFRWQTIRAFSDKRELIARVADLLLRKDEAAE